LVDEEVCSGGLVVGVTAQAAVGEFILLFLASYPSKKINNSSKSCLKMASISK